MNNFLSEPDSIRLIKKYPNRRLYDTCTSAYITIADVKQLVMMGEPFAVIDVKTNVDITHSVLLQIVFEEETAGRGVFAMSVLEQIIRCYGSNTQYQMANHLEQSINVLMSLDNT